MAIISPKRKKGTNAKESGRSVRGKKKSGQPAVTPRPSSPAGSGSSENSGRGKSELLRAPKQRNK